MRKVISCPTICLYTPISCSLSELSVEVTFMHKHTNLAFLLLIGCGYNVCLNLRSFYQNLERLEKPVHRGAAFSCISLNEFLTLTQQLSVSEMFHWQRRGFPHKATFHVTKMKCSISLLLMVSAQSPGLLQKGRLSVCCKLQPIFSPSKLSYYCIFCSNWRVVELSDAHVYTCV